MNPLEAVLERLLLSLLLLLLGPLFGKPEEPVELVA
jgi:hypothetical protein